MTDFSSEGIHYGRTELNGKDLIFTSGVSGKKILEMKLDGVEQCIVPASNRQDLEIQFSEGKERQKDSLVQIVFHFPPETKEEVEGEEEENDDTLAEKYQAQIMDSGIVSSAMGDVIVEFTKEQGNFVSPRGKYELKLTSTYLQMRGTPYKFNIMYENMDSFFLLEKSDNRSAFVICLKQPIRMGNQKYLNLVLETHMVETTVEVNLTQEEIDERYDGQLTPELTLPLATIFGKVFKVLAGSVSGAKVFVPKQFSSSRGVHHIRCTIKANEGLLYPLAKAFIFIHKPTIITKFEDIESVEFERYQLNSNSATKNFDLKVYMKESAVKPGEARDYTYLSIDRAEYSNLYDYLASKEITVRNPKVAQTNTVGLDLGDDDEDSDEEDDDYKAPASESSEGEDDDDENSDEEGGGGGGEKKASSSSEPKAGKKRSSKAVADEGDKKKKRQKKEKDPNAPKGATTSFMLFSNANRAAMKAENPDLPVTELSKLLGAKWREMSKEEKEPYEERAKEDKQRYDAAMKAYKASKAGDDE